MRWNEVFNRRVFFLPMVWQRKKSHNPPPPKYHPHSWTKWQEYNASGIDQYVQKWKSCTLGTIMKKSEYEMVLKSAAKLCLGFCFLSQHDTLTQSKSSHLIKTYFQKSKKSWLQSHWKVNWKSRFCQKSVKTWGTWKIFQWRIS